MKTNDTNETGRDGFGCDAFAEELSLFVFGELEGERLAALEQHLTGCAACRSERDALQRSLEILKSDGAKELQPQLSAERQAELMAQARIQASAQILASSSARVVHFARWAIAAGVIAMAGLGAYAWRAAVRPPIRDVSEMSASVPTDAASASLARAARLGQFRGPAVTGIPLKPGDPTGGGAVDELIDRMPAANAGDKATLLALDSPSNAGDGKASLAAHVGSKDLDDFGVGAPVEDLPESEESRPASAAASAAKTLSAAPSTGAPAFPHKSAGPASTTADGREFTARQQIGNFLYQTPDATKESTEDAATAFALLTEKQLLVQAGRPNSREVNELLEKLGYLGEDAGGAAAPHVPLDPALVGRILAATCSPSQVVLFQNRLAAALGVDPAQPRADLDQDRDTIVREFLDRLSRRQNEPPRDMFFRYFGDHPFVATRIDCKSTFGMDVDTASYTLARAYLAKGMLPPKAAIRTEEFVNAFKHGLTPPSDAPRSDDKSFGEGKESAGRDVFAINTEVAPSPFGDEGQLLLQVGLKARVISKAARKPVALTFIIDVSGSMAEDGRLELVKQSLHLLVDQLDERDTIGIVSFETTAHRILAPVNATNRAAIFGSLDQLRPEGSTDVEEGLRFGYAMALAQLKPNAENRVILCSDGVANTGVTDPKQLSAQIAECKSKYIYLNCVGVGMGNHNDALLEQLADEGDGFCAYVDKLEEAKKIFVERLTGTLMTVARNAKIQVEFDPASVRRFRQIGYENRALAHRDFRNDKVDAGEVGAGQEVVALYEIEPKAGAAGPLATVRVRYEDPDTTQVREQARPVFAAEIAETLQKTTARFRLSACVAEFAEILRQSVHARDGSFGAIERLAEPLIDELRGDADVPEFVALVKQAARLPDLLPPRNEMVRTVDELKKLRCWREELRDAKDSADESLMRQLEEQNRKLEQMLRDSLDRALRHS